MDRARLSRLKMTRIKFYFIFDQVTRWLEEIEIMRFYFILFLRLWSVFKLLFSED